MPIPLAYRSAMMRPRQVTRNASVIASGAPKPALSAVASLAESTPAGQGPRGSTSPMGHGVRAGSGWLRRRLALGRGAGGKEQESRKGRKRQDRRTHDRPPVSGVRREGTRIAEVGLLYRVNGGTVGRRPRPETGGIP